MRYIHGAWVAICLVATVVIANLTIDDGPSEVSTAAAVVVLLFMATVWAVGFCLILVGEWLYRRRAASARDI